MFRLRVNPEIFNSLEPRTGEGLRVFSAAIVKSKDATPFISFDFTNTVKLVFSTFNEFTYKETNMVNKYFNDLRLKCLTLQITGANKAQRNLHPS